MQHLQKLNIQNFSQATKCYVWQEQEFQSSAFAAVVGKGKGQKGGTLATGLWHVRRSCVCSLGLTMHWPSCSAPPPNMCPVTGEAQWAGQSQGLETRGWEQQGPWPTANMLRCLRSSSGRSQGGPNVLPFQVALLCLAPATPFTRPVPSWNLRDLFDLWVTRGH